MFMEGTLSQITIAVINKTDSTRQETTTLISSTIPRITTDKDIVITKAIKVTK